MTDGSQRFLHDLKISLAAPTVFLGDRDGLVRELDDDRGLCVQAERCPLRVDEALGATPLGRPGGGAACDDRQGRKRQQRRRYKRAPRAQRSESHMCLSPMLESQKPAGRTAHTPKRRGS